MPAVEFTRFPARGSVTLRGRYPSRACDSFCIATAIELTGRAAALRSTVKEQRATNNFSTGKRPAAVAAVAAEQESPDYERLHEECHRRTVAELLADILDAGIVAM